MSKNGNTKTKIVRKDPDTLKKQEAKRLLASLRRTKKRKENSRKESFFVDVTCKTYVFNLDSLYTRFYRLIPRQWQLPKFYQKFDDYMLSRLDAPEIPHEHEKIFAPIYAHILTKFDGLSEHAKFTKWAQVAGTNRLFGSVDPILAKIMGMDVIGDRQIEFTLPYS